MFGFNVHGLREQMTKNSQVEHLFFPMKIFYFWSKEHIVNFCVPSKKQKKVRFLKIAQISVIKCDLLERKVSCYAGSMLCKHQLLLWVLRSSALGLGHGWAQQHQWWALVKWGTLLLYVRQGVMERFPTTNLNPHKCTQTHVYMYAFIQTRP